MIVEVVVDNRPARGVADKVNVVDVIALVQLGQYGGQLLRLFLRVRIVFENNGDQGIVAANGAVLLPSDLPEPGDPCGESKGPDVRPVQTGDHAPQ